MYKLRKFMAYIFTIPAFCLFWIAEQIMQEKIIPNINKNEIHDFLSKKTTVTCSKCGHKGSLYKLIK